MTGLNIYTPEVKVNQNFYLFTTNETEKTVTKLIEEVDIPIAFGSPMQEEYTRRYRKPFQSLFHADDPLGSKKHSCKAYQKGYFFNSHCWNF